MKGFSKILEVLISIIFLIIAYFTFFYPWRVSEKGEILKLKGMQALKSLDDSGVLDNLAFAYEEEKIEELLAPFLPSNLNYKVLVCDGDCSYPEINSEKVVSVFYLIAGNYTHLEPREILLYIW